MSKFSLKVDLMRVGSWSIIVIEYLRDLRDMSKIGEESIRIVPDEIYVIPSKVLMMVVFPAPVLPTIPIFSPGLMLQLIPLRTSGRSFLYLAFRFLNSIAPAFTICSDIYSLGYQF